MKLYVAGPMRGRPDHGFPDFFRARNILLELGHNPVLPIEEGDLDSWGDPSKPYADYMKRDIRMLSECDGILLLPGWEDSVGATFEARCALEFDLPAFSLVMVGPDGYVLGRIAVSELRGAV